MRNRARLLLAVGLAVCAGAPASPAAPLRPIVLPPETWSVHVVPGPHPGPPLLRVAVRRDAPWPAPPEAGDLELRVDLLRPDGSRSEGIAWLDERFRAAEVPLFLAEDPAVTAPELLRKRALEGPAAGAERRAAEDAEIERLIAQREVPYATVLERLAARRLPPMDPAEEGFLPDLYARVRVLLVPVLASEPLRQEIGPRAPEAPRYTWGQQVARPGDPCMGRTPEECVRERLRFLRDRFCNPPPGMSFPFHCIVLALRLSEEPSTVNVRCSLPGAAASVSPGTLEINVNGEYFLTQGCLEAVLLHELQHVFDLAGGEMPSSRELYRLLRRIDELEARLLAMVQAGEGTADERRALLREIVALDAQARRLVPAAGRERLETECRALFAALDHAAFVGPWEEVLPWLIGSVSAMITQQLEILVNREAMADPEGLRAFCDCLRRIRAWLDAHPDARDRFARTRISGQPALEFLDETIAICPP